jgi:hypothetical protein
VLFEYCSSGQQLFLVAEQVKYCVMCNGIVHFVHYVHYLIVEFIESFQIQVSVGLSIEGCMWKETHAKIADSVDSLCDQFSPLFSAGWLAYINKIFGANQPRQAQSVGKEPVVVED